MDKLNFCFERNKEKIDRRNYYLLRFECVYLSREFAAFSINFSYGFLARPRPSSSRRPLLLACVSSFKRPSRDFRIFQPHSKNNPPWTDSLNIYLRFRNQSSFWFHPSWSYNWPAKPVMILQDTRMVTKSCRYVQYYKIEKTAGILRS